MAGPFISSLPALPAGVSEQGHRTPNIEVGAGWLRGHLTLWVRGGWDVAKQGVDANQLVALLCYKLDISKRFANAAGLLTFSEIKIVIIVVYHGE